MIGVESASHLRAQPRARAASRFLPLALVLVDGALIYGAFVLAYWTRYSLEVGPLIQEHVSFLQYQPIAVLLLGIMLPLLFFKGAYSNRLGTEAVDHVTAIFSSATITIASIVVVTAMLRQWVYSRGVIVYLWLLVIVLVSVGRVVFRAAQGALHRRGWGVRRVLVVGGTDIGKMVMQGIRNRPDLGYLLVGFVGLRGTASPSFGRFPALGSVADIPDLIDREAVDEIIIALPASAHEEVSPILSLCEERAVGLKIVPDLFEMSLGRVQVDDIAGIPLLDVRDRPLRRAARAVKRAIDITVALIVSVVGMPLLAALAVLIRLESPGPALINQERVGMGGRTFRCYKLRTMQADAPELQPDLVELNEMDGPLFKIRNDPRCTRVGKRIRRWSLDELPQIWNVLLGDMSLVGPRPPLPSEVAQYSPQHMRRLEVKPGMTGIWQVSGRNHLKFDEMVLMDIYYVENWSPALDVKILIRTVIAVLTRHGAY